MVAAKIITKSKLSEKDKQNLHEEMKIMRRLDHPNILSMVEVYDETEYHIIITEIASGGELFDRIVEKRHYTETEVRSIV